MKRISVLIICTAISLASYGQVSCDNALYDASRNYEAGNISEALRVLTHCVKGKQLEKSQLLDANRLLTLCYINLNQTDSAKYYAAEMLRLRPNYQEDHFVDPAELTTLINSFSVKEKLQVGVTLGASVNQAIVLKNYSPSETPSTYLSRMGLGVGFLCEYSIRRDLSVHINPNYNSMSYRRELENVAGRKKEYTELITTTEIPLVLRYGRSMLGGNTFVQAGGQMSFWNQSFADVQSISLLDGSVHQSSTETTSYRVASMTGYQFGIGFEKDLGPVRMSISLEHRRFASNVVLADRRYDNVDFILDAQYIDADLGLSSTGICVGFKVPVARSVRTVK